MQRTTRRHAPILLSRRRVAPRRKRSPITSCANRCALAVSRKVTKADPATSQPNPASSRLRFHRRTRATPGFQRTKCSGEFLDRTGPNRLCGLLPTDRVFVVTLETGAADRPRPDPASSRPRFHRRTRVRHQVFKEQDARPTFLTVRAHDLRHPSKGSCPRRQRAFFVGNTSIESSVAQSEGRGVMSTKRLQAAVCGLLVLVCGAIILLCTPPRLALASDGAVPREDGYGRYQMLIGVSVVVVDGKSYQVTRDDDRLLLGQNVVVRGAVREHHPWLYVHRITDDLVDVTFDKGTKPWQPLSTGATSPILDPYGPTRTVEETALIRFPCRRVRLSRIIRTRQSARPTSPRIASERRSCDSGCQSSSGSNVRSSWRSSTSVKILMPRWRQ